MPQKILRKYGEAATINFALWSADGVDIKNDASFAAGDIKIMKNEGAEANTTNLPTDEGQGYSLALTATEMQAARIVIYIVDQTATKTWLDDYLILETYGNASAQHAFNLDYDFSGYNETIKLKMLDIINDDGIPLHIQATSELGNYPAIDALGAGSGAGAKLTGGPTGPGLSTYGGSTSGNGILCVGNGSDGSFYISNSGTGGGLQIAGGTNANALSLFASGTGNGIRVDSSSKGVLISSTGIGIDVQSSSSSINCLGGIVVAANSGTDDPAISLTGDGSGAGASLQGGITGNGILVNAGATSGTGVQVEDGVQVVARNSVALSVSNTGVGISVVGYDNPGMQLLAYGDGGSTYKGVLDIAGAGQAGGGYHAISLRAGLGAQCGIYIEGGIPDTSGGTGGAGIKITRSSIDNGNATALVIEGIGSGSAVTLTPGSTGDGLSITGGGTSGDGIKIYAVDGHGMNIEAIAVDKNAIELSSNSNARDLNAKEIGAPFTIDGISNASIFEVLSKFADDNGGADYDAGTDSLANAYDLLYAINQTASLNNFTLGIINGKIDIVDTNVDTIISKLPSGDISDFSLTDTVDGIPVSQILEYTMAMFNGKFDEAEPAAGQRTFYKRNNSTVLSVVEVDTSGRRRIS